MFQGNSAVSYKKKKKNCSWITFSLLFPISGNANANANAFQVSQFLLFFLPCFDSTEIFYAAVLSSCVSKKDAEEEAQEKQIHLKFIK